MKTFFKIAFAVFLAFGITGQTLANESKPISIKVDGVVVNLPDAKPFIDPATNRTMVPIRFISEKLGAKVEWNEAIQTVKIDRNGKQITLRIGEKKATVSGKQITFDASAILKQNRTFVPLRFISEAYDAQVDWKAAERLISIQTRTPVIKDASGRNFPVDNKDKRFQAFHQGLQIKNGVLTGTVPQNGPGLYVGCQIYFKPGHNPIAVVVQPGESFSYKVEEINVLGITIIDQANKKVLASYTYRDLPALNADEDKPAGGQ
ncbi:copper amine oxidase N-terminal domain-containing protein (plasmid) [Brevibacillus composti]|uniref:Copper amine oxidase N-terminal domain-containing protein n=1 Tax=Brevibacillus composti TaxID=2796470 RepID=A0A7T5EQA9_9BACL|nr:copper amine oxidase N-terminal domain-containing protein [Brevibacillus composti]QQE76763.1 copper amine oxidase N-terminal domain-containing protein [Brevibacillus composti]QUO43831.1 copper amine oxidase N-terminal domain-containing protein [Brevibacillus composti]